MIRALFKLFFILLLSTSNLAFAQNTAPEKPKTEENKDNFFDFDEAPISYKGAFIKMMLTLLGLITLIVFSVWMLKRISHGRMKQMNYGRSIKIVERRPLSAKSILYLVEIDGKRVVVSESQLEVRTITTADQLSPDED